MIFQSGIYLLISEFRFSIPDSCLQPTMFEEIILLIQYHRLNLISFRAHWAKWQKFFLYFALPISSRVSFMAEGKKEAILGLSVEAKNLSGSKQNFSHLGHK